MNIEIDTTAPITVKLPLSVALNIHRLLCKITDSQLTAMGFTERQRKELADIMWRSDEQIRALTGRG